MERDELLRCAAYVFSTENIGLIDDQAGLAFGLLPSSGAAIGSATLAFMDDLHRKKSDQLYVGAQRIGFSAFRH